MQLTTLDIGVNSILPRKSIYQFSSIFEIFRVGTKLSENALLIGIVPMQS